MKKKNWKIGNTTDHKKPFPVVNLRFRPIDTQEVCASTNCQSLEYLHERPRAAFVVQVCMDKNTLNTTAFTEKELGEMLWEKAYREQVAGKEPEALVYPFCVQCTLSTITHFLGETYEQDAGIAITKSISRGEDIILFDRNLSRGRTDPAIAVGKFDTLAHFRRLYFEHGAK